MDHRVLWLICVVLISVSGLVVSSMRSDANPPVPPILRVQGADPAGGAFGLDDFKVNPSSGNVSGEVFIKNPSVILSAAAATPQILFIDPQTMAETTQSITSAVVLSQGNTRASWAFSDVQVPAGKEFYGVELLGSMNFQGEGVVPLSGRVAAWQGGATE